ncbi:hypothetical protein [Caenimonas koreensis]|uniref:hypothetical protein n=1 Tax=Caenimonas koreensis TaxID=367474 RepID=UPI003784B869
MSSNKFNPSVEEVIANGRRVVKEAEEALARSKRLFAENNIDPEETMALIRKRGGDAAVRALEAQAVAMLQEFEDEMERQRVHGTKPRQAGKPARVRNMI